MTLHDFTDEPVVDGVRCIDCDMVIPGTDETKDRAFLDAVQIAEPCTAPFRRHRLVNVWPNAGKQTCEACGHTWLATERRLYPMTSPPPWAFDACPALNDGMHV